MRRKKRYRDVMFGLGKWHDFISTITVLYQIGLCFCIQTFQTVNFYLQYCYWMEMNYMHWKLWQYCSHIGILFSSKFPLSREVYIAPLRFVLPSVRVLSIQFSHNAMASVFSFAPPVSDLFVCLFVCLLSFVGKRSTPCSRLKTSSARETARFTWTMLCRKVSGSQRDFLTLSNVIGAIGTTRW